MTMRLSLQFPDDQAEEYALVATVCMPDGVRNLACHDVMYDEDRNVFLAVIHEEAADEAGDPYIIEHIVGMWPPDAPFIAVAQNYFNRKSDAQLFEEELEEKQALQMMQERAQRVLARKKPMSGPEPEEFV